ncbi:MAG: Ig-like domain-containing protein [Lachnospiraceae bacterium]|nr:Ig-like domain-containing protein [Lachnospiraceae bacterium]
MKSYKKKILYYLCVFILILSMPITAFAHSGKTDSNGGHKDNKNKSGLGSYHYHCGGYPAHLHTDGYCPYRDIFPSSVKVNAEKETLGIGEKVSISANIYPENSCDTNVTWSSSDSNVVAVSNGMIEALNYGTAIVTAESFNGKKGTLKVTVKEIVAENVTISEMSDMENYYIGTEFQLKAYIEPENVDNPTISWSSSDAAIATVSSNRNVKLLAEGKAEIKATASNGVEGKITFDVKEKPVESVEMDVNVLDLNLGAEYTMKATVYPADATFTQLTWESTNQEVASVSEDGRIKALACGQTVIIATSSNGIKGSVSVNVNEIVAESLVIDCPSSMLLGEEFKLGVNIIPENATNQSVQWKVDNNSIVEILEEGRLVTKGLGKVVITAVHKDVTATHELSIFPIKVENVQVTSSVGDSLSVGETSVFKADVYPENATYPNVTWSTSDSKIATIDSDGVLTALKGGTVNVIATTDDGFWVGYEVKISSPITGIMAIIGLAGTGTVLMVAKKRKKKHA